ncbi:MAG: cation-transporting P-type ATPase [Chitinophagales bacterium]
MKASLQNAYALDIENVFKQLDSSDQGINSSAAVERLAKYGLNVLPNKRKFSIFLLLIKQFQSWLILILIIAAIISVLASHVTDSIVIAAIIIINATIGFYSRVQSRKCHFQSTENGGKNCKSNERSSNGFHQLFSVSSGDVVILEEGDSIPADGRIFTLKISEH